MQGNDISNDSPPRLLVHISELFISEPKFKKVLGLFPVATTEYDVLMPALAYYQRWRSTGLLLVAFYYEDDVWPGEELWEMLDQYQQPFKDILLFRSTRNVSDYLAYNTDVVGVVDPLHPMRFGSWSRDGF